MLDEAREEDLEEGLDEAEETIEGGEETVAGGEEDSELSIVIDGEDPEEDVDEAELTDAGKRALQRLREVAKENARKAREAEARLAEAQAAAAPKREKPKQPTLEECGYNDVEYARRMREFVKAEEEEEAEAAEAQKQADAAKADYESRMDKYRADKTALKVRDFDAAEDAVRTTLTKQQQSVLIRTLDDPAKVIYALGTSKKALADLAAVKELDRFAYRLAKIEGEIKVTTKTPPAPESKLRGGNGAGTPPGALHQRLAAAQKAARDSGDYTEVLKIKRQIREAAS